MVSHCHGRARRHRAYKARAPARRRTKLILTPLGAFIPCDAPESVTRPAKVQEASAPSPRVRRAARPVEHVANPSGALLHVRDHRAEPLDPGPEFQHDIGIGRAGEVLL